MSGRVAIVGGGVAGLEALLALHDLAGDRAEVTLVAPDPDFLYKPLLVEEPFDLGPAEQHALAPVAEELGARFLLRAVRRVDAAAHALDLGDGLTGEESLQLRSEIAGGGGEGSASLDALWWPPHKISGRYLAPWLYHGEVHAEPEPPRRTIDVEVALPVEWHEEPLGFDS